MMLLLLLLLLTPEQGTMRAAFKMKFVNDDIRGSKMFATPPPSPTLHPLLTHPPPPLRYVAKLTLKAKDRASSVQYEKVGVWGSVFQML